MNKGTRYHIHEIQLTQSEPTYYLEGSGIMFDNQGNTPVWIGLRKLLPGDAWKIDIAPPHYIKQSVSIRFESAAVPIGSSLRVINAPILCIFLLKPE